MRAMSLHNNLTNDTSIEVFLKNRVLNNIKAHLENNDMNENERGVLTRFINTDGFLDMMSEVGDDEDLRSIATFDTTPKERVLSSLFGSGYVPKMIRDRLQDNEMYSNLSPQNNKLQSPQLSPIQMKQSLSSTNENQDIGHHLLAMKMLSDSNSQIGAYGKRVPSRGLRIGSPMPVNPFQSGSSCEILL